MAKQERAKNSDAEIDSFVSEFLKQPAQITMEQFRHIEKRYASETEAQWRHMALLTLTKSVQELVDVFGKDDRSAAEAAADCSVTAKEMASRFRSLADLLECAGTRLWVALCRREDAIEILEAADLRAKSDATWPELTGHA